MRWYQKKSSGTAVQLKRVAFGGLSQLCSLAIGPLPSVLWFPDAWYFAQWFCRYFSLLCFSMIHYFTPLSLKLRHSIKVYYALMF